MPNLVKLSEFTTKKNEHYLISLSNIVADVEISLFCNNKFISKQNSPIEKASFDYVMIGAKNAKRQCSIFVKSLFNIQLNTLPLVKSRILVNDGDIDYFKNLYDIGILWNESAKNTKKILNIIDNNLIKNLSSSKNEELIVYKLAIFYRSQKYQDVINFSQSIDLDSINDLRNKIYIKWYWANASLNTINYNVSIDLFQSIYTELNGKMEIDSSWELFKFRTLAYLGLAKSVRYYFDKFQKDNGKTNIEKAIKELSQLNNKQLIAESLYFYGAYYSAIEEWGKALATLEVAEKYTKEIKDSDTLISIYNQKAIAYSKLGQIKNSIDSFRFAIRIAIESNSINENQFLFSSIASIYEHLGNHIKSERFNKKYLNQILENNLFGKYSTYNKLGRISRAFNEVNQAIEFHLKSRAFYKGKEQNTFIDITSELSIDFQKKKEYRQAEKLALQVLVFSNFDILTLSEKTSLGIKIDSAFWENIDIIAKNTTQSLKFILSHNKANFQTEQQIKALQVIAGITKINGTNSEFNMLLRIIESGLNLLPINLQLDYYQLKIDYLKSENKTKELTLILETVLKLIEKTRKKFDVSDLALHWTHQAKSILDKYINVLIEQKKYIEIFNLLEKYYAINLREKRQNTTSQIIQQQSKEIQQALDDYVKFERETLLSKDNDVQNKADEAKEHFLALNENKQTTQKQELTYLTIEELQQKLSDRELFLRYYLNEKYAFVFVIDNKSLEVMQLPDKSQLRYTVKTILNNIKSKRFNELAEQNDLFNKILPQEKIISGLYEKIIIIPDGVLNLLPFASININPKARKYTPLVSKINIERTYSASDYFADIELPKNEKTISVFSNPVFLQASNNVGLLNSIPKTNKLWEFVSLPNTSQEAEAIEAIFSNFEIYKMSEESATNENLLSEKTLNSNIIHIATHGFFNDENLENVGIATTIIDENNNRAPGVLAMREILYQPFKANLAVVSGCETTLGKEINGEGFNSLSRGLLSQGVGSVIGTIWSISDRATPVFMKEFYTNLRDMNGNVSKALNATKSNFATQARFRRYRHPYYWAGFVLTSSNRGISENIFIN
jgi:CHAT domain-containing protein